jgi:hypothetical protein
VDGIESEQDIVVLDRNSVNLSSVLFSAGDDMGVAHTFSSSMSTAMG